MDITTVPTDTTIEQAEADQRRDSLGHPVHSDEDAANPFGFKNLQQARSWLDRHVSEFADGELANLEAVAATIESIRPDPDRWEGSEFERLQGLSAIFRAGLMVPCRMSGSGVLVCPL